MHVGKKGKTHLKILKKTRIWNKGNLTEESVRAVLFI